MVTKLQSKNYITSFSKNSRNERLLNIKKIIYSTHIITHKLSMLKQIKTMLNLFEHVHYPNFLSSSSDFVQPLYWGFFSL